MNEEEEVDFGGMNETTSPQYKIGTGASMRKYFSSQKTQRLPEETNK